MEVALIIVLAVGALAVAVVWMVFYVLATIVKAALWGLSRPFRNSAPKATRMTLFADHQIPLGPRCANPHCRAEMPLEARFCGRCGSAVAGVSASEPLPDATYVLKKCKKRGRRGKWRVVGGVMMRPTVLPPRRCKVSRVA